MNSNYPVDTTIWPPTPTPLTPRGVFSARLTLFREYNGGMRWGFRIRIAIFLLVLGWFAYGFLELNGGVREKLYYLFGSFLAMIVVGLILEINPFSPFKKPESEEKLE